MRATKIKNAARALSAGGLSSGALAQRACVLHERLRMGAGQIQAAAAIRNKALSLASMKRLSAIASSQCAPGLRQWFRKGAGQAETLKNATLSLSTRVTILAATASSQWTGALRQQLHRARRMRAPTIKNMALALSASFGVISAVAIAQETFQSGALSAPTSAALGVASGEPEDHAIPVGNWLLYPTFTMGYLFNDNVYGRPFNRVAASGLRVRPALEALSENGIHRTMAYVDADFQLYPGLGVGERYVALQRVIDAPPTNIAGRVGALHVWEPLRDLTVRASIDASRQTGLFSPFIGSTNGMTSLPNTFSFSSVQQYVNQFSGVLSAEKKIGDRGFVRASASAFYTSYDNRPQFATFSSYDEYASRAFDGNYLNGFGFRGALRGGAWITPQIYAFAEPAIDLRRYSNSFYDTNGYRVLAGLGSDMLSLFRGEIYGGYQSQSSLNGLLARSSAPSFGARLFYYPTRDITLSVSADQTLSSTSAPLLWTGVTAPFWHVGGHRWASAALSRQILGQGEFNLTPKFSLYMRGGYGETSFSNPSFSTQAWSAGGGINYNLWRNLSLNVDYQFLKTQFRVPHPAVRQAVAANAGFAQGFTRNMVSVGFNWKF